MKPFLAPLGIAAVVAAVACTPLHMGESQATLQSLLDMQARCDAPVGPPDGRDMIDCPNNSDALAKLAGELAAEAAKTDTTRANAVFFYRRAATAAWRSEQPKAMDDAVTYAQAAIELCGTDPAGAGIPPGDCAISHFIAPNVVHDRGVIEQRRLKTEEYLSGSADDPAKTRMGSAAQLAFQGWLELQSRWRFLCCGVHPSAFDYAVTLQNDMVENLRRIYVKTNGLPTAVGYADDDYADACGEVKSDGRLGGVRIKDVAGKDDLTNRVNRWAWCRWQAARRNPGRPPE